MNISQDMIKEIILDVLREMRGGELKTENRSSAASKLQFQDIGEAKSGTNRNEVVIGITPAFGSAMTQTIINIPHRDVLKELMAGIEEEGLTTDRKSVV